MSKQIIRRGPQGTHWMPIKKSPPGSKSREAMLWLLGAFPGRAITVGVVILIGVVLWIGLVFLFDSPCNPTRLITFYLCDSVHNETPWFPIAYGALAVIVLWTGFEWARERLQTFVIDTDSNLFPPKPDSDDVFENLVYFLGSLGPFCTYEQRMREEREWIQSLTWEKAQLLLVWIKNPTPLPGWQSLTEENSRDMSLNAIEFFVRAGRYHNEERFHLALMQLMSESQTHEVGKRGLWLWDHHEQLEREREKMLNQARCNPIV